MHERKIMKYEIISAELYEIKVRITHKCFLTRARRHDYKPSKNDPNGVLWKRDEPHPGYEEIEGSYTEIYTRER